MVSNDENNNRWMVIGMVWVISAVWVRGKVHYRGGEFSCGLLFTNACISLLFELPWTWNFGSSLSVLLYP
jgi:hypothetical protein